MIKLIAVSDLMLLGKRDNAILLNLAKEIFRLNLKIKNHIILGSKIPNEIFEDMNQDDISICIIDKPNFVFNQIVARYANCELIVNEKAKHAVEKYYSSLNLPLDNETSKLYFLPDLCEPILYVGLVQGYIINTKNGKILVIPNDEKVIYDLVLPLLKKMQTKNFQSTLLRTFGLTEDAIRTILSSELKNKDRVSINIFDNNGLIDILIKSHEDNQFYTTYVRNILNKLSKFVYAEDDISLAEAVFRLLKLNKMTISFAESITGGGLASALIKTNNEASEVIKQSFVTYSENAKVEILGVKPETLKFGESVSSMVAYEMAKGLLEISNSDIAVSVTGFTTHKQQDKRGLVYIAVGDEQEIHVFKNKFDGTRQEIIDKTINSAFFYLLKKLR